LVNQLIEAGQLTEEEAETFEHNNIILQALGTAETVQVDLTFVDLRRGDTLLLCSDGLSGMIRAEDIRQTLLSVSDPLDACKLLTEKANQAGGHDNITVIVVKFDGAGLPQIAQGEPPLKYQKYALPHMSGEEATVRPNAVPVTNPIQSNGPPSAEAARESRSLRVGHTMVGAMSPLAGHPPPSAIPSTQRSANPGPFMPEEPVELPTTGLPPQVVGAIVVGLLLLVVVMGFWLLR
jgi:protein phosphatase